LVLKYGNMGFNEELSKEEHIYFDILGLFMVSYPVSINFIIEIVLMSIILTVIILYFVANIINLIICNKNETMRNKLLKNHDSLLLKVFMIFSYSFNYIFSIFIGVLFSILVR
jgi:hypothetical protein